MTNNDQDQCLDKRCPFCGCDVVELAADLKAMVYFISCWRCYARGPMADNQTDARRMWNDRGRP